MYRCDTNDRIKAVKWTVIFVIIIFIVLGIFLSTGDIRMNYGESSFKIEASYWGDKEISYSDIENMEYRNHYVNGTRTGGFGSFRLEMGSFQNKEFGSYTRYTYVRCNDYVILTVNGKQIVINGKTEEETKDIYHTLEEKCK